MGYGVFHAVSKTFLEQDLDLGSDEDFLRYLQEENDNATSAPNEAVSCDGLKKSDTAWETVLYTFGILYMFLALAIVCDEFFVPALEELSGPRRLNMSMDVAGATLMAAGGSAPELATSLIGTFRQSEIGFGTIVGSAVFNILFVIGMCSLLAKDVLTLTWWPLFRDSLYYTIGLVMLAVFTGFHSKNKIELWESCVLFAMYLGYCLLMWQNKNLYKAITGKVLVYPDEEEESEEDARTASNDNRSTLQKQSSKTSVQSSKSHASIASHMSQRSYRGSGSERSGRSTASHPHFLWQGTFRAGILKLLKDGDSWADTAGAGMVSKIMGDADYVFEQVDKDGNGHIDKNELRQLFDLLECNATQQELEEVFVQLDDNQDGVVSHIEGVCDNLYPPTGGGFRDWVWYIICLPLVFVLTFTVPDVQRPGYGKWCYLTFIISIAWIGGFSYFMVDWAEIVGNTIGIPSELMGLTILAAGTSVPDLLSSVIVARRGQGDMAVSSSVGSNIFDILVGLPVPWMLYSAFNNADAVNIGSEGLVRSLLILVGMIVLVIGSIHCQGWKLTKILGGIMFLFYIVFLVQAVVLALPFELCNRSP
eukprot:jgi/Psemu1/196275/e_gw1.184.84.1